MTIKNLKPKHMKTTKNKSCVLFLILSTFGINLLAQGYGEIRGIIKDTELDRVPFATIKILQGNYLVGGTQADEEGNYHYKPLNPGIYELLVIEPGHLSQPVNKINVVPNQATYVDVTMQLNVLGTVTVTAPPVDYSRSGVEKTMFSFVSLDAKELNQLAGYSTGNIQGALELMSSDVIASPDGSVHFRGSRGDASGYFVDGVRTLNASNIPGLSIQNITVFSGGVPASYGDVTSGAILITTKGYFSGLRDKNIRINEQQERLREDKKQKKALEEEKARKLEIDAEKNKVKKES
jgi:hypothetical protein